VVEIGGASSVLRRRRGSPLRSGSFSKGARQRRACYPASVSAWNAFTETGLATMIGERAAPYSFRRRNDRGVVRAPVGGIGLAA